jgi:hypothetical protein
MISIKATSPISNKETAFDLAASALDDFAVIFDPFFNLNDSLFFSTVVSLWHHIYSGARAASPGGNGAACPGRHDSREEGEEVQEGDEATTQEQVAHASDARTSDNTHRR